MRDFDYAWDAAAGDGPAHRRAARRGRHGAHRLLEPAGGHRRPRCVEQDGERHYRTGDYVHCNAARRARLHRPARPAGEGRRPPRPARRDRGGAPGSTCPSSRWPARCSSRTAPSRSSPRRSSASRRRTPTRSREAAADSLPLFMMPERIVAMDAAAPERARQDRLSAADEMLLGSRGVRAMADPGDGRFGGHDFAHDSAVLGRRKVAHVLPPRETRGARRRSSSCSTRLPATAPRGSAMRRT